MTDKKPYPVAFSETEIKDELTNLSNRIQTYDTRADVIDSLIKDAVRFNLGYSEFQHRENKRLSRKMLWLSIASVLVAIASFCVAWVAYQSGEVNSRWQDQQIRLLSEIRNGIADIKESQTKPIQMKRQKGSKQPAPNKALQPTP
jgi:hypothetical protein